MLAYSRQLCKSTKQLCSDMQSAGITTSYMHAVLHLRILQETITGCGAGANVPAAWELHVIETRSTGDLARRCIPQVLPLHGQSIPGWYPCRWCNAI